MSSFWSAWIIVLTLGTIAGTTWILFANRKTDDKETTGHVFDGIEEYDNPLPAWWFWGFLISIIFAVGYIIAYPGLGNFAGVLGWTQQNQYENEVSRANDKYGPIYAEFAAQPIAELAQNERAMRMAGRLFTDNCAQCHGADAMGSRGFPNLTDNVWNWGGEPEQILATITHGRTALMQAWEPMIGTAKVAAVTDYVVSLSDSDQQVDANLVAEGEGVYKTYCVACHGADGTGNVLFGAPDLTDGVWLYGGSKNDITLTIAKGRNGAMPAQKELLYPEKIHLLAAYVYGLSRQ